MLLRWLIAQTVRNSAQQVMQQAAQQLGTGEPLTELPPTDVLLLFALSVEAQPLVTSWESPVKFQLHRMTGYTARCGELRVTTLETGVGRDAARRAMALLPDVCPALPRWLISAGFAGSLQADVKRGDIVLPSEIIDEQGIAIPGGGRFDAETIAATRYLHSGRLLTVDRIVGEPEERTTLAATHDAIACDMETHAIALAARELGMECIAVRVISDGVDDRLPEDIDRLLKQNSLAAKLGAATGALFRRPGSAKDLWNLREQANRAARRLAQFLQGTVDQLQS